MMLAQDDVIFVPLYSMEPDLTLHEKGVEHEDVKKQIEQFDRYVGVIYDNITRHPVLKDQVNVIFIGKNINHRESSFPALHVGQIGKKLLKFRPNRKPLLVCLIIICS